MTDQRVEEDLRVALASSGTLFDIDGDGVVGDGDRERLRRLIATELATRPEGRRHAPTLPVSPQVVDERWQLLGVLGRGGQATTYLARDLQRGGWVAVKELDLGRVEDWKSIELFEREGEALERLDHPSIPSYIAHLSVKDGERVRFYLVQQFVAGADLGEELQARGTLDEAAASRVRDAVFDILEYLHGHNPPIVHRDIKPSNLLLMDDGQIVLVDFGAVQSAHAKTSGGSTIVGTTGYMPMEQYMGRAVPASDLYALGATLVHLMSGVHPGQLPVQDNRLVFEDKVRASAPFLGGLHALLEPAVEKRVPDVTSARKAFETALVAPEPDAPEGERKSSRLLIPVAVVVLLIGYFGVEAYTDHFVDPRNHFTIENIHAEPPANAKRVLFVGNSHTYWSEQPQVVARMVPDGQPPLWFEMWAWPGADVMWHIDHDVGDALEEEEWDTVILQPQSVEPAANSERFGAGMARFEKLVPNGTESIVWVPWARHPEYDIYNLYDARWSGGSYEELTRRLEKGVRTWIGSSRMCPIGEAWLRVRKQIPKAPLHSQTDGNKATKPGVYLNGLMLYGCIYERDPTEVTWVPEGLNPESAKKLRRIASETLRDY